MKWLIQHFDCVNSTNETARSLPLYHVVVAEQQSTGKGRLNRTWESPKGGLYLSAVAPGFGPQSPLLSFVAAISVVEALPGFDIRIKWPNDLLLNKKKLAGILLEQIDDERVIIGIGINVASVPHKKLLYEPTSLGNKISIEQVEKQLLKALEENLNLFQSQGFVPIREKWLKHAAGLGEQIKVNLFNQSLTGLFKELTPCGELILETPDKIIHKITAGDVFLMR